MALSNHHDGLELAKIDLRFRGPGQVFGVEQKGFPELKVASLFDYELIKNAKTEAESFFENNQDLRSFPFLKKHIENISDNIHME